MRKKKHVKGKGLNLISPNDFENELREQFVVFAFVARQKNRRGVGLRSFVVVLFDLIRFVGVAT
jgi:hypothetical protein